MKFPDEDKVVFFSDDENMLMVEISDALVAVEKLQQFFQRWRATDAVFIEDLVAARANLDAFDFVLKKSQEMLTEQWLGIAHEVSERVGPKGLVFIPDDDEEDHLYFHAWPHCMKRPHISSDGYAEATKNGPIPELHNPILGRWGNVDVTVSNQARITVGGARH